MSRRAFLRWSAALMVPLMLAAGSGFALTFVACLQSGQVHLGAGCQVGKSTEHAELVRTCCEVKTVQLAQPPGAENRRDDGGARMVAGALLAVLPRALVFPPPALVVGPPAELPDGAHGPPLLLVTRALLI